MCEAECQAGTKVSSKSLMIKRAAGIARIDLVHAAARHIGGELVHGQELGGGLLADPTVSPVWSSCPWVSATWVTPLIAWCKGMPGILEGGVAAEERIDQDAAAPVSMRKQEWPNHVIFMRLTL